MGVGVRRDEPCKHGVDLVPLRIEIGLLHAQRAVVAWLGEGLGLGLGLGQGLGQGLGLGLGFRCSGCRSCRL